MVGPSKWETINLGYLGECYVKLELAKRNFVISGVDHGFHFDMLGQNGLKIEVKTALPSISSKLNKGKWYKYDKWQFRLTHPKQFNNDFTISVVLESPDKPPLGYFIIPTKEYKANEIMTIFVSDLKGIYQKKGKKDLFKYFNNWESIINHK